MLSVPTLFTVFDVNFLAVGVVCGLGAAGYRSAMTYALDYAPDRS